MSTDPFADLNPTSKRDLLARALQTPSDFAATARAEVDALRALRDRHVAAIKQGRQTVPNARDELTRIAGSIKAKLSQAAASHTTAAPHFRDNLHRAATIKAERRAADPNAVLKELLEVSRANLVEQQLQTRREELDALARRIDKERPADGGQTIGGALNLLAAVRGSDPAAEEYARRTLAALRANTAIPEAQRAIDQALARPDAVSAPAVDAHLEALARADDRQKAEFVRVALAEKDASKIVAGFVAAHRQAPGTPLNWCNDLLGGLADAPDAAVNELAAFDATRRRADAEAAAVHSRLAAFEVEELAQLGGVESPSQSDLYRQQQADAHRQKMDANYREFVAASSALPPTAY